MKVLITGGGGFIGSHLADRLSARGDEILILDNYVTGRRDNIASGDHVRIVEGSIADPAVVDGAFDDFAPDVVIHAAASYRDPDGWSEDIHSNVLGTTHVVRASQRHDVRRVIYFQTSLCYGLHPKEQPITITHPINPECSSYSVSKTGGEQYIHLSGLDYVSFRLANPLGPRTISGPLPTFFRRLSAGQKCFVTDTRRDFIFIDDLVDVVEKAVDGRGSRGPYHIASGVDVSIKELFDTTVAAMGVTLDEPVEVRAPGPDDAASILLDPSKTNADFDWKVSTPFEEAVRRSVAYYQEFGLEETYTHLRIEEPAASH
ncbi:MAG: NAD-dependent epimerase/dehydratase family protein [Planctomycetes bacterium]|nr:NAD-dependent epimerase/dehydratase family protein [Planctomycetota bacterium]